MDDNLIDFIIDINVDQLIKELEDAEEFYTADLEIFTNFLDCVSTTDRLMGVKVGKQLIRITDCSGKIISENQKLG